MNQHAAHGKTALGEVTMLPELEFDLSEDRGPKLNLGKAETAVNMLAELSWDSAAQEAAPTHETPILSSEPLPSSARASGKDIASDDNLLQASRRALLLIILQRFLQLLDDPIDQNIVLLAVGEKRTISEIAEILSLSRIEVVERFSQSVKKLRDLARADGLLDKIMGKYKQEEQRK